MKKRFITLVGVVNLRREIALNDIEKIEIQDSGKVYKYQ